MKELILASASPRRRELLAQVGIACRVAASTVEEKITAEAPQDVVMELSRQKCRDVAERCKEPGVFLGADTVVAAGGRILGKPSGPEEAREMLGLLQGRTHQVYTGVTLLWRQKDGHTEEETFYEKTDVTFYPMSSKEIREYVAAGEPEDGEGRDTWDTEKMVKAGWMDQSGNWNTDNGGRPTCMDKAGAYGIQGLAAKFIRGIDGDYNNVVGLPVAAVYQRLQRRETAVCRIRPVREEELRQTAEIEARCFPAAEAASYEELAARFRTCRGSFFVAESEEGRLLGFCNGCCTDSEELTDDLYHDASAHDPEGKYQMIFGLNTLPEARGLGVGTALMRHMIESASRRGKAAVILTCKEHMIPFYERIGFVFEKKADSSHGGAVWYKMVYRLR